MRVELSDLQKDFYRQLLAKHLPVLVGAAPGAKAGNTSSALKVVFFACTHFCRKLRVALGGSEWKPADSTAQVCVPASFFICV